jgi:hypothetical protein
MIAKSEDIKVENTLFQTISATAVAIYLPKNNN